MVSVLDYPLPLIDDGEIGKTFQSLPEEARRQLISLANSLAKQLSPLCQAGDRKRLEYLADDLLPKFESLLQAIVESLQASGLSNEAILELSKAGRSELHTFIDKRQNVLGKENAESLIGTMDSLEGFLDWIQKSLYPNPTKEDIELFDSVYKYSVASYMLMVSVQLILSEKVKSTPETLSLLCEAANDYMTEVEDRFLATSSDLEETTEEDVPLKHVREHLGI